MYVLAAVSENNFVEAKFGTKSAKEMKCLASLAAVKTPAFPYGLKSTTQTIVRIVYAQLADKKTRDQAEPSETGNHLQPAHDGLDSAVEAVRAGVELNREDAKLTKATYDKQHAQRALLSSMADAQREAALGTMNRPSESSFANYQGGCAPKLGPPGGCAPKLGPPAECPRCCGCRGCDYGASASDPRTALRAR